MHPADLLTARRKQTGGEKRRPTEQGGIGEGIQPLRLVTHERSPRSDLKPHKPPAQSSVAPTHLGLSSAVREADNSMWMKLPRVCAENASSCFSIAQLWRSSNQSYGTHHNPLVWFHLKATMMHSVSLKCDLCSTSSVLIIIPNRSLRQLPAKKADLRAEAALLQPGGSTDNHSKRASQAGLYHGKLRKPGRTCKLTRMANK